MTWHDAIQRVLAENGEAMHVQDITDRVIELGLRRSYGATPHATVSGQLAASVKRDGDASPYVKVASATYGLRRRAPLGASRAAVALGDDTDGAGLVQAFGMYWQRDAVFWSAKPKLRGRQHIGAEEVDFAEQVGVYLLHDGREVVYVGRSTDRPLGRRLYEHTKDRLQARWNRFSWFGLLTVTEDARLREAEVLLTPEVVAITLEAVLIEGLEPRQNRRRGDGFNATEYLQAEDPEIERRQGQLFRDSLKSKL